MCRLSSSVAKRVFGDRYARLEAEILLWLAVAHCRDISGVATVATEAATHAWPEAALLRSERARRYRRRLAGMGESRCSARSGPWDGVCSHVHFSELGGQFQQKKCGLTWDGAREGVGGLLPLKR